MTRRPYDGKKPYLGIIPLHESPILAAHYLSDIHVGNSITHAVQLMSLAHRQVAANSTPLAITETPSFQLRLLQAPGCEFLYKPTYRQGVWATWALQSNQNYAWLLHFFKNLGIEYSIRFGKSLTGNSLVWSKITEIPDLPYREGGVRFPFNTKAMTSAPQLYLDATHHGGFNFGSPIDTHRYAYCVYRYEKARWTNRGIPSWFKDYHIARGAVEVEEKSPRNKDTIVRYMKYPNAKNN